MLKGACELKSAQFALMRLAIYQTDANAVQGFVADQVAAAPALLEGAPVAIDLTGITGKFDLEFVEDIAMRLRYAGMLPIALVGDPETAIAEIAIGLKLGLLAPQKRPAKLEGTSAEEAKVEPEKASAVPASVKTEASQPAPAPVEIAKAIEVTAAASAETAASMQRYEGQVRSGQQLYAKGRDLLVSGPVNNGAEVISDGSVHIYGRLSGKVIAGATGDASARIYCLAFGAELVSIAGVFRVFESIPASLAGRPVQIWREGDKLRLEALI